MLCARYRLFFFFQKITFSHICNFLPTGENYICPSVVTLIHTNDQVFSVFCFFNRFDYHIILINLE